MFKIDKNMHMMILMTFAIIFIVVYLYYTIVDFRKLQAEFKKISDEFTDLKGKVANLPVAKPVASPSEVPQVKISEQATIHSHAVSVQEHIVEEECDDESIDINDIKKTFEYTDDEEEIVDQKEETEVHIDEAIESTETIVENSEEVTQEPIRNEVNLSDVEKMKYEELREFCRKLNISSKGNKEQMIKRIHEHFQN